MSSFPFITLRAGETFKIICFTMRVWPLALLVAAVSGGPSDEFAEVLVQCIRSHAKKAAQAFPSYGNVCMAPTEKIDIQVNVY